MDVDKLPIQQGRLDFPLYVSHWFDKDNLLIAGGGGAAKTGVKNGMGLVRGRDPIVHCDTEKRKVLCIAQYSNTQFFCGAGQHVYCCERTLAHEDEPASLRTLESFQLCPEPPASLEGDGISHRDMYHPAPTRMVLSHDRALLAVGDHTGAVRIFHVAPTDEGDAIAPGPLRLRLASTDTLVEYGVSETQRAAGDASPASPERPAGREEEEEELAVVRRYGGLGSHRGNLVRGITWSPDDQYLVTISESLLLVHSISKRKTVLELAPSTSTLQYRFCRIDGAGALHVIASSRDGFVYTQHTLNLEACKKTKVTELPCARRAVFRVQDGATCFALSEDAAYIAAGGTTGELSVFRLSDRRRLSRRKAHLGFMTSIAFAPAGDAPGGQVPMIASTSGDYTFALQTALVPRGRMPRLVLLILLLLLLLLVAACFAPDIARPAFRAAKARLTATARRIK